MSEPFLGEIRMFAGNFAPRGWAFCDGQLLAVSTNDALFSLFGTLYGGDGRSTFGLPDLRGRVPVHAGQGPGLSQRRLGAKGGAENVTLTTNQLPSHRHALTASSADANAGVGPTGMLATTRSDSYGKEGSPDKRMATAAITPTGGSQPHTNMAPSLGLHYIVALVGIYPSRQ